MAAVETEVDTLKRLVEEHTTAVRAQTAELVKISTQLGGLHTPENCPVAREMREIGKRMSDELTGLGNRVMEAVDLDRKRLVALEGWRENEIVAAARDTAMAVGVHVKTEAEVAAHELRLTALETWKGDAVVVHAREEGARGVGVWLVKNWLSVLVAVALLLTMLGFEFQIPGLPHLAK